MPREDETYRAARYGGHPPYCTCVDCNRRRLERQKKGGGINWKTVVYTVVTVAVVAVVVYLLLK